MRRFLVAPIALAGALLLAACSDDDADPDETTDTPAAEEVVPDVDTSSAEGPTGTLTDPPTDTAEEPPIGDPILEVRDLNSWYHAVLIDERAIADPIELEAIGREICLDQTPCRAAMWYSERDTPAALPVNERSLRLQVFAFGRTLDGSENILWNCNEFLQFEAERRCLPRILN